MSSYPYFVSFGLLQLVHSQEEIWTGFHKQWFLFRMPQALFVAFEIAFSSLMLAYIFRPTLPFAVLFMPGFIFLMLLNGIEHVIWALAKKRYVPGLVTAPFFIALFLFYITAAR